MNFRRLLSCLGLFLLGSVIGQAAPGEIFPGLGRKWQHHQSPHFELYSANSDRDSRDVLEKMELLRAVFMQEFNLQVRIPRRVKIYYFSKEEEFRTYTPPQINPTDRFSGYYFSYPDQMILTMAPTSSRRWARDLAYRQCARFLFQLADEYPPDWFLIGIGGLMSTLKEEKEGLVLGGVVPEYVEILDEYGMDSVWQVLAREPREVATLSAGQRRIYDAKCWAILHYCMFANVALPPVRRDALWKIAGSELSRNRPRWFAEQMAGLLAPETSDLTEVIHRHIQAKKLSVRRISRPEVPDRGRYEQRAVDTEEMIAQLAELGYRAKQTAYGTYKVQEMFARDPSLRLRELIGAVAQTESDLGKVRDYWGAAVDLGTTNAAVLNELCRIEGNNVFTQFNLGFRLPEKRADRLRELLHKSIAVAPEQSSAYEMLLWVEAYAANPREDNIARVEGRLGSLNDQASATLALALVQFRRNDPAAALLLLDKTAKLECTTWIAAWAEILRATLEQRPINQAIVNRRPNRE